MNIFLHKFKGHSLLKEITFSVLYAVIFNSGLFLIGLLISQNYFVTSNFISIYYGAIVGFIAIYATIIAISVNLSQELPLKISLKYILYSRLNLSYLFIIGLNIILVHFLFLNSVSENIENSILVTNTFFLFLLTLFFILAFMNKFKLEHHIKSFFEDMIHRYSGDFTKPTTAGVKNYEITEKEGFFLIASKNFPKEKQEINPEDIKSETMSAGKKAPSINISKQRVLPARLPIYIGKGKVQVKNWEFLDNISIPVNLRINKYEFGDENFTPQIVCEYYPPNNKKEVENELKKIIKENIKYKDFPKEEFKELFDKLKKNGAEEKLISMIKNYIAKEANLQERRFLYFSFEEFFKESELNKKRISDIKEVLNIDIKNLYEQKELFFKSPAIIAKLQDKLTSLLIANFRKVNYMSPQLNISGFYIKEFLDVRYTDIYEKSEDWQWIQEYEYLINNTIKNIFSLCRAIIELDIKEELKKKYLVEQIGNLNKVLEHYDYLHETDFLKEYYDENVDNSKKDLADKKMSIIRKQQEYLKEKQSELFYLILYNIDKEELTKDFFEIAIKIYNLKNFDKQYYKYERIDKLDWLNYDWFSGGVQTIEPFNFNRYRLLISFYKYLKSGEIDIKRFENENFTDTSNSFEKELDNITEKFISKYFEYDKNKFIQFKRQLLKEIKEKKESIKKNKQDYIIKTPLKTEYVDKFIKDCKEAWEKNQKDISQFMQLKTIDGGSEVKTFFGQYTLFDKEWFLDEFDKNVTFLRDTGKVFGISQSNSKLKQILDLINKLFNEEKGDKEIIIKEIHSDLAKEIKPNKEYFLFYGSDLKIHNIPNLNWSRQGIETANLNLNNSIIHFCYSYNPENLLFEKGTFILEQYKQGYEKINEPLVVQIEPIDKDTEIQTILEKNKKYKSPEDVRQLVKIRIAEKFNVKRTKNAKLIRLKI